MTTTYPTSQEAATTKKSSSGHTVPLPIASLSPGHVRGTETFPQAAHRELNNATQRRNLFHATHTIREKRARHVAELDDWEELRQAGSDIKRYVASQLPELLEQFEAAVTANGGHVHWARDGKEAGEIITSLIQDAGADHVVKIKSMASQEIELNEQLEAAGISAQETDLAELIVQLGHDMPSHILVPAIHRNRAEIRDIFVKEMPHTDESLSTEPAELAEASRLFLRKQFMETSVALSGANFGIAETGTVTIVESEGNGRMCLTLPDTLISLMGIEKLLPTFQDLEVFLQLLPRSSTGERMNPYTSFWSGVTPGDGPKNFHIVLMDNGRTRVLSNPVGREALKCIRCSACLNVCPVYERAGGHAYGSIYPGPIGSILSPQLTGLESAHDPNASLPFASSLCARCSEVCPVKIPIDKILVDLRHEKVRTHRPPAEGALFAALAKIMGNPTLWNLAVRNMKLGRILGGFKNSSSINSLPAFLSGWSDARETAIPPKKSFRAWLESDEATRLLNDARRQAESHLPKEGSDD